MNLILFGPPGAGKGTQADKLVKKFNLYKVSTGDLLRDEVNKNTPLGNEIKVKIEKGLLVPDELINNLVIEKLSNKKFYNRLIFDGYPRNLNQAKIFESLAIKHNQKIARVFSLNVNKDVIIKRILGRLICKKCGLTFNKYFNPPQNEKHECEAKYLETRSDDNEITVKSRYETYTKDTLPILDFYADQKILSKIDGTREINEIYNEICGIIASLET